MSKLRVLSGRDACKILAQHGFEKVRQKGSHIIMQKQVGNSTMYRASARPCRIENRYFVGDHQTIRIAPLVV